MLSGFVFGIIGEGLVFSIGIMILKIRGVPVIMTGSNMTELMVAAVIGTALWGAIGVGVDNRGDRIGAVVSSSSSRSTTSNLVLEFVAELR